MQPRRPLPSILLAISLALTSCGRIPPEPAIPIEGVDRVTLFSLEPFELTEGAGEPGGSFHDHRVLGRLEIEDPDRIEELVGAFNEGVAQGGVATECFWPRHALRVVRGGQATDYLICFKCSQFITFLGGMAVQETVADSPEAVFDSFLVEADIPKASFPWEDGAGRP